MDEKIANLLRACMKVKEWVEAQDEENLPPEFSDFVEAVDFAWLSWGYLLQPLTACEIQAVQCGANALRVAARRVPSYDDQRDMELMADQIESMLNRLGRR